MVRVKSLGPSFRSSHARYFNNPFEANNIFEATLRYTVRNVCDVYETILSITRGDLEPLQHLK